MKALSKSRFKLGLECPNKLYFSNNSEEYHNIKSDDTFLQALASGGFQIEEYARLMYPNGVLIDTDYSDTNYQELANQTTELLKQENVIIYEAAFYSNNLFIRTDILEKKGNTIKLIEVKAKSINPQNLNNFVGKNGGLVSGWKPYLFDLAFQTYVAERCFPEFQITPFLCLVDKTKTATVDGLNQFFRVKQNSDKRTGVDVLVTDNSQMGGNLLHLENLSEVVLGIINNKYNYYDNLNFDEAITLLRDIRIKNYYPNWPAKFSACKKCEFKSDTTKSGKNKKSGFEHCLKTQFQLSDKEFEKSNIFNIWNLKDAKLMEQGILFKDQLTPDHIKYKEEAGFLSAKERQWLQIEKERSNDFTEFIDIEGLQLEMRSWVFPLHFIDFETSTVPLPFHVGRNPYEQIAFQFSHHIYHEDGRIEHASEYINITPGMFPNFEFVKHLYDALINDNGTIFRYSSHENTILNAIRDQLFQSNYPYKDVVIPFIESISKPKDSHTNPWPVPSRNMVDLCDIIIKYYYNPYTFGSNSIKKVLPAILKTSPFVQNKYSLPIGQINVSSKNFHSSHIWLTRENGEIKSPYKMLPPVFENFSAEAIEAIVSSIENIDDGGAALMAYGKIQYTDMSANERLEIAEALKRYCELDTLAMVIIYEHLKSKIA